jgi:hypothetical protein
MQFRLALQALICLGLMSGSAFAVTAQTNAPAHVPAASASAESATADENASDNNPAPAEETNPYSAIVRANVFKLTEPPPPPKRDDPAILNLPKVNITGFRRREGEPVHALFATVPKDPKEPARYFNLAEGEKEDILELKKIDPSQEFVEVIIAGTPTTLTVKSNSFVQPIVVPKQGVPGAPGMNNNPGIVGRPPGPMAVPNTPGVPGVPGIPAPAQNQEQPHGGVVVAGGSGGATVPVVPTAVNVAGGQQPSYPGGVVPNNHPGFVPPLPNGGGDSGLRSIPTRGIRTGQ